MKFAPITAVVVAAIALSASAQAGDVVITETLTGTITSGTDTEDLFVGPNANLSGYSVTLQFSYDYTTIAGDTPFINGAPDYEQYFDASGDGAVTDTLTINGNGFTQTSTDIGSVLWGDASATSLPANSLDIYAGSGDNTYIEEEIFGGPYSVGTGALGNQSAIDANVAGASGAQLVLGNNTNQEVLEVSFTSTPEPSTWLPLVMGLAGFGWLKFRRGKSSR